MAAWRAAREIENPTAHENAKQAYIRANANKTRRRKLEEAIVADGPAFRAWLFDLLPPELAALSQKAGELWNEGQRLAFTVTVKPSDDDPTMGFGSRPAVKKAK